MSKQLTQEQRLSKNIAKLLLPRIKRIVEDAVDKKVKDLVYESVTSSKKKVIKEESNDVFDDDWNEDEDEESPVSESKKEIANRARRRARNLMEKGIDPNDPTMQLILDAEDPEEKIAMSDRVQVSKAGSVKAEDLEEGEFVNPEEIDYSSLLEDL